jgi:hypothetical protein
MKDLTDSVTHQNRVNHANWAKRLIARAERGEAVAKDTLKQARAVLACVRSPTPT